LNSVSVLQDLARVAHRGPEGAAAGLAEALAWIREALRAETAYVLYGDDQFHKLGDATDPGEYEVKAKGYWLLQQFMVKRAKVCAFNVVDRKAQDIVAAQPGVRRGHAAVLIPMPEGTSEMLIVGGLREQLRQSHIALLEVAAPIVAHLVAAQADCERSERQKQHLNALGDIARVMTRSQDMEQVLEEVATAVAGVSGFDIVTISVLDPGGKRLARRVVNRQRYSEQLVARYYKQGALDEGIIAATRDGETVLYPDLANDSRLSEQVRLFLSAKALFTSMARFPLIFQGETLGLISVLSFSPHSLDQAEVKLLEGMAAQVTMTLKGLEMYDELRSSREKLQEYTERLQESVSVENRLARTDPLTGIPNRRYLNEAIASEAARALKEESGLTLVLADVDEFKYINDRFGHALGDDALRLVASLGWQACRHGEIVGRYGGDEFLFILPNKSSDQVLGFGEEFRQAVEKATLYAPPSHAIGVTVSVGVSECGTDVSQPSRLVEMADKALYQAKAQGRNRVVALGTQPAAEPAV
jgi:diguanylate cyclase (GGDEF)-like protein